MSEEEVLKWVNDNVCDYEPEWTDYDVDQAVSDMLYNFFTDELDIDVTPHEEHEIDWVHKELLVNTFKKMWLEYYN